MILVTGASGFIGGHLVKRLSHSARGTDIGDCDLRTSVPRMSGITSIYHLAADMGGIGYITGSHASIARNNSLINLNMLEAARVASVPLLFSSSACVYQQSKQRYTGCPPLKEVDAWPADPEPGYGMEKLYAEKLCEYYRQDYGLNIKVARFHNVYGPNGAYDGGKEKSVAALCRKVAQANNGDSVDIWGDGKQTRSYLYVDDCVEGLIRLMNSQHHDPLNLGTDRMVSIAELFSMICKIAGKTLVPKYDTTKPQGVRGRNCDCTQLRRTLNWIPQTSLEIGLEKTYQWIESQISIASSSVPTI